LAGVFALKEESGRMACWAETACADIKRINGIKTLEYIAITARISP
jgi:hypothetical protein